MALALALGFIMGGALSASAATVYSSWANFVSGSTTYSTRAYLTDAAVYGQQTKRADGASSSAGYLGSYTQVFLGTTSCGSQGPLYNGSAVVTWIVHKDTYFIYCGAGYYHAQGFGDAYNPSTGNYVRAYSVKTPLKWFN